MLDKLLEWLFGILARPSETLNEIAREKPVGLAFMVYLLIVFLNAFSNLFTEEAYGSIQQALHQLGVYIPAAILVAGTLGASLLFLFVSTGFVHLLARLFGGKGGYWNFFSAYAFSEFPMIISVPVAILFSFLGWLGAIFGGLISFGLFIWVFILNVIAVRESYGVSTAMSFLAYLIHLIVLIVIPVAIAVAILIASVGAFL